MNSLVRIDGPVKIGPNHSVDLNPFLEDKHLDIPGYEATFKVASIVLGDDRYDFDQIKSHRVDSMGCNSDSLSFAVDNQVCVRLIDFGLTEDNVLIVLAADKVVEEIHLEYIDITPL